MIYAVDIDGTLTEDDTNPENWFRYADMKPIRENIAKINDLYMKGEKIILYTSRYEEDREVTVSWLKINGVKYHRLIMDKFRADIYVDSASQRPEEL